MQHPGGSHSTFFERFHNVGTLESLYESVSTLEAFATARTTSRAELSLLRQIKAQVRIQLGFLQGRGRRTP